MAKNLTLALPDELYAEMEKLKEVNWSQVARNSIQQYLERRKKPELQEILLKLDAEKGEEYVKGVEFAKALARSKGYPGMSYVIGEYERLMGPALARATSTGQQMGWLGPDEEATDSNLGDKEKNGILLEALKKSGFFSGQGNEAWLSGVRVTVEELGRLLGEK
jgi:hypothetical protein